MKTKSSYTKLRIKAFSSEQERIKLNNELNKVKSMNIFELLKWRFRKC